ncbi:helix-turn-helix domain-containing protein [Sphingomonas crusticola]|uniref:helix-turn-helix domain-containing protein n=1 Tax=Sphingomonas crusticola TaxID=1697973 RepID=UPI001F07196D|nr:helix-turn-helix domain-containing protein [Sphingomonas crusticola]
MIRNSHLPDLGDPPADMVVASEPLTIRVSAAVRLSGLSRSRIYELIQSGDLATHKVGRTTLIPYRSLKHLVIGSD